MNGNIIQVMGTRHIGAICICDKLSGFAHSRMMSVDVKSSDR